MSAAACDLCPDSSATHEATGTVVVCVCGRVYARDDFRWPVAPSPADGAPHEALDTDRARACLR
ncbi:hypothetical protein, partial [Lactococcus petauri]|uniref:hypothetical protein n=1 Tax=Lactococcus petauri TaxID=1940789 RepID=UPI0021F15A67